MKPLNKHSHKTEPSDNTMTVGFMNPSEPLPNQIFFQPRYDFLRWLANYVGSRQVVDCGAGVGHFASKMDMEGILVTALDIVQREEPEFDILPIDATTFEYRKYGLPIIARPCGGAWIRATIEQALKTAGRIMYIGVERNFERDLEDLPEGVKKIKAFGGRPVGNEDELAFILQRSDLDFDVETWCLVTLRGQDKWWMEDCRARWINTAGGHCYKSDSDVVHETVEVTSLYDLDWTKTTLIDPKSETGWLGPDGTFWGCKTQDHNFVAKAVVKIEPGDMDEAGWIKVVGKNQKRFGHYDYFCHGEMTAAQKSWLIENGYEGYELEEDEVPRTATLKVPGILEAGSQPRRPSRLDREGD